MDLATGREAAKFGEYIDRPVAQLDDTGSRLALVGAGGDVTLHELPSGKIINTLHHPGPPTCLSWTGEFLATGGAGDRLLYLWDTAHGRLLRRMSGNESSRITSLCFRPGGQELISMAHESILRVWHVTSGIEILRHPLGNFPGRAWIAPDGRNLYCQRASGEEVEVFHFDWSRTTQVLGPGMDEPHSENVPSLVLDQSGDLAAAVDETSCRVWSLAGGRLAANFPKLEAEWMTARFAGPDNLWLSGWNRALRRVPVLRESSNRSTFGGEEHTGFQSGWLLMDARADSTALVLSKNDKGSKDDQVAVYFTSGERTVNLDQADPFCAALSEDGHWAATGSFTDSGAKLWHLPSGEFACGIPYPENVQSLTFSGPDLWLAGKAGVQRVLPGGKGQDATLIPGDFSAFTISPDGHQAASLARTHVVLLRTPDLVEVARLQLPVEGGGIGAGTLAFSGVGTHLALHSATGRIIAWDLKTLREELRNMGMDW